MNNGIIDLDSDAGKEIGFTSDKFDGYLWKLDDEIIISFIESKKRGNFRALVEFIRRKGYRVIIPTPLGRMRQIVKDNGYHHKRICVDDLGEVDIWSIDGYKQEVEV